MRRRSKSPEETYEIASAFAGKLKPGDVLALVGELGAGKTRFVQGLAHGLGVSDSTYVRSPSPNPRSLATWDSTSTSTATG